VVTLLLARGKRKTRVPNVVGLTPVQADQHLVGGHLTLGTVAPELDPKAKIASQVPAARRRRAWGTPVNVVLAGATVKVPKVVGLKAAKADQRLAKAGLKLGKMNPQPDAKLPIASQIPSAGAQRPAGTPVDVFLKQPKAKKKHKKNGQKNAGGTKAKAQSVPATSGQGPVAAAAAVETAGLQPRTMLRIDGAAPGTVLRTLPAAGDAPPSNGVVRIVVSAGFPRLAYDIGTTVFTAAGTTGGAAKVSSHAVRQSAPSWIPGGRAVVVRSDGRLVMAQTQEPHNPVSLALGRAGDDLDQPAVAGNAARTVLAFVSHRPDNGDLLCFSRLSAGTAGRPSCRRLAGWRLGEITWTSHGRRLLVAATQIDSADWRFGLLRLTTDRPFSTNAHEWHGGRSLATPAWPGHGVATAAADPSGRRLAVVTNTPTGRFQIAITTPGDLALKHAKVLPVQGCDVAWRPDGAELAIVQSDNKCREPVGRIVRVSPAHARTLTTVVLRGRDPAWQPVELGPVSLARASALGTQP
jgi:beta-lactam-binding protein with PASTA domain